VRLPTQQEERRLELTILPMVNVVFLLLIFFMLVGRIAPYDELDVAPPLSQGGEIESGRPVRIVVAADGRLLEGGQVLDMTALIVRVADRLRQNPAAQFQLKADAELEASRLIRLMEILRQAGVKQLTLLTESSR